MWKMDNTRDERGSTEQATIVVYERDININPE